MESNHRYFARRAAAEAQAALRSVTDEGRALHQELARRFTHLAEKHGREEDELLMFR